MNGVSAGAATTAPANSLWRVKCTNVIDHRSVLSAISRRLIADGENTRTITVLIVEEFYKKKEPIDIVCEGYVVVEKPRRQKRRFVIAACPLLNVAIVN